MEQNYDLMPSCILLYPAILDEIDPPYEGPIETVNMDISKLNVIDVWVYGNQNSYRALVVEGHKFLRIECPVSIITPAGPGVIRRMEIKALWDTGATNTYIPMDVAVRMGIPLGEPAMVERMKSTEPSRYCQFYLQFQTGETIFVPEAIAIPKMQSRFIIGMDVIGKGVTTIEPDGQDGVRFTFTL